MRFWFVAYPDIPRPIGGIKQIHRLAEAFQSLGFSSYIIQDDAQFHPGWFQSTVSTVSLSDFKSIQSDLTKSDFLVIPETYVPGIGTFFPGVRKIIFNQNSSYTFGLNPAPSELNPKRIKELYSHPEVAHVLCVSEYDFSFLGTCLGLGSDSLTLVSNSIDFEDVQIFAKKSPRACYMPRKNYNHATVVVDLLKGMQLSLPWEFTPLSQLSHSDVLRHMSISSAFLSFGHPEGFGLPVAEALASGCFVIGYTGLAGREFLELEHCSSVFTAVEFGDLASFVQSFLDFDKYYSSNISSVLGTLASSSASVRNKYTFANMVSSISHLPSQLSSS